MQERTYGAHEVELRRKIEAPPDRVFDAFTRPDLLSKWFTTAAEADLRVGGRYRNGDHDTGEFLAIERPGLLRFTWENADHCPGTTVEVVFRPLGEHASEVSLRHRAIETSEGAADMSEGWSWALDSLKSFIERGKPIPHSEWLAARKGGQHT